MAFYNMILAALLVQNKGLGAQKTEEKEWEKKSFYIGQRLLERDVGLSRGNINKDTKLCQGKKFWGEAFK